jgi:hypothetical protein
VICRCAPTHRGRPIDLAAYDAHPPPQRSAPYAFVIVPGFTPRFGWRGGLHPKNIERLERALTALSQRLAPAVIVSGAAVHSADNEALLMHEWLMGRGVERDRVLIEPCARHTTTNLRNAGRLVLSHGAEDALVVTSDGPWLPGGGGWRFAEQAYYLGYPWLSTFHLRCLVELGYQVGELRLVDPHHVHFRPSNQVFSNSWKESWMGDP